MSPVARHSDPHTSHDAARSLPYDAVRYSQRQVWRLLASNGPSTDEELGMAARRYGLPISASGLRTRRSELVERGYVIDTGARARTASGRRAIVWAAIQHGPLTGEGAKR